MSRIRLLRPNQAIALGLASVMVITGLMMRPSPTRADGPATAPSAESSKFQQQRIDTLRQAASIARELYSHGSITFEEVCRMERLLIDAQLESAVSAEERIKLVQGKLDVARKQEEMALRQSQAGLGTVLAPLEAKADRLRIEIQLTQMNAK